MGLATPAAIMAGSNLYWAHAETELRELAEALGIPVFLNGMGRGCLPPDHELYFSRARSTALQGCDVALVIGVPLDFRLGFGAAIGEEATLVVWFFMHARSSPRLTLVIAFGGLLWLAILLALTAGDYLTR